MSQFWPLFFPSYTFKISDGRDHSERKEQADQRRGRPLGRGMAAHDLCARATAGQGAQVELSALPDDRRAQLVQGRNDATIHGDLQADQRRGDSVEARARGPERASIDRNGAE